MTYVPTFWVPQLFKCPIWNLESSIAMWINRINSKLLQKLTRKILNIQIYYKFNLTSILSKKQKLWVCVDFGENKESGKHIVLSNYGAELINTWDIGFKSFSLISLIENQRFVYKSLLEARKLGVPSNFHGRSVQFISEKALATELFFFLHDLHQYCR